MERHCALVIPENWAAMAEQHRARLNTVQPCFAMVMVPGNETLTPAALGKAITAALKGHEAKIALAVLPRSFAVDSRIRYWPEMVIRAKKGITVTSVIFADDWRECIAQTDAWSNRIASEPEPVHASCQYEPPYTGMMQRWVNAGAVEHHPGDYYKDEFLDALSRMRGHWLYWGHADPGRLRGYHHLETEDLLRHRPAIPLSSALWFSCGTLGSGAQRSIALDWYLSGATHCLFAATQPVPTNENMLLSDAFLHAWQSGQSASLAGVIHHLATQNSKVFLPILKKYRLIGNGFLPL